MKKVYVVLTRCITLKRESRGFKRSDIKRYRKMLREVSPSPDVRVVEVFSTFELAKQNVRNLLNQDYTSYHYTPFTDVKGNVLRSTLTIYDYFIEETFLTD